MTHIARTAHPDRDDPTPRTLPGTPGPPAVRVESGKGGLPRVIVTTPAADAEIYLQGAHVTAWAPAGEQPVVWTSARSVFARGAPIRGGVPVCFPWFGPDPGGTGPVHGPVRLRPWTFAGWSPDGDDVVLAFTLSSHDLDGAPQPFALRYTVGLGTRLTLALEVTNTGPRTLRFEEALHTYLAVRDVREVTILGLGDLDRVDRRTGRRARTPAGAQMHVVTQTDHLYARPGPVTVVDWPGQRSLRVRTQNSAHAVLRNPWAEEAAALPDLGDEEWPSLLCVATCNVGDAAVVLPPGAAHTMVATLEVGPLP